MTIVPPYPSLDSIGSRIGALISRHIDLAFRRLMSGPGVEIQPRFLRLVTGEAHPFGNFVCMSAGADAGSTEEAIEPLLRCGAPSAVLFSGEMHEGVRELLSSTGFASHGGMPAMGVDIDALKATELPHGYELSRVQDAGLHERWGEVFARGYGLPRSVGNFFAGCLREGVASDPTVQYFWILKDGEPVGTSLIYLDDGVAGVYAVSTIVEERGKGLGAHLTAQPLRLVRAIGYRVGVLQASEDGHPVYRRLGFSEYGEVPLFVRMPV